MQISDMQKLSMYTPQEIGKAIKKRRKELKLTQKEFADRLDKSERTVQKYETGEIAIKLDVLKQIADELDMPWQELLEGKRITDTEEEAEYKKPADIRFQTFSDVIETLFSLAKIPELSFRFSCNKPPENPDWTSSLTVNGKGTGMYDADFCLFMENWIEKQTALQQGQITEEQFEKWQKKTLKYYSKSHLSDPASSAEELR